LFGQTMKLRVQMVWRLALVLCGMLSIPHMSWAQQSRTDSTAAPPQSTGTIIQLTDSTVQENVSSNTLVGELWLDLPPEDQPKSVGWILEDAGGSDFQLDGNRLLTGSTQPNYEERSRYRITVRALLSDARRYRRTLTVRVLDVNEAPRLVAPDELVLPEHMPADSLVASLSVQDPDSADRHQFSLLNDAGGRFRMDGQQLRSTNPERFDYESDSTFTLSVAVEDSSGLQDQQQISVRLRDQNDVPTDLQISDNRIPENSPSGTPIGRLTVDDQDRRDRHEFLLVDSLASPVAIRSQQLVVSDSSAFNFEQDSVLTIPVKAQDTGGLSVQRELKIRIQNVNEAPIITGLQDTLIQEDDIIARMPFEIRDPESVPRQLRYHFTTDSASILPRSGILMFGGNQQRSLRILPRENEHGTVQVELAVSDGVLSDTARWNIRVESVNDPPVIERLRPLVVTEGELVNLTNDQLWARDIDHNPVDLEYHLIRPPEHGRFGFNTAKQNASLRFSQLQINQRMLWYQHDGSEQHRDTVWLSLQDPAGARIDSIALPVAIRPVNNPPKVSTLRNQRFKEDQVSPQQSVRIWDAELPSTQLQVWGKSGNPKLVADSGIITTGIDRLRTIKARPRPDQNGEARIQIFASDGQDTTSTSYWITVTPVNDPPRLDNLDPLEIPEDTGYVHLDLGIRDVDTPLNQLHLELNSTEPLLLPNDSLHLYKAGSSWGVKFQPRSNRSGTTTLEYAVSDGEFTKNASVLIKVESVNDAPDPFDQFAAQPKLVNDSLEVEFRWDETQDVDDNKLEYLLSIRGQRFDTLVTGLSGTKMTFEAQRRLESNTEYQWRVYATDGKDTTASRQQKAFLTPALPDLPTEFALEQNYPNPFNPSTTITYRLPVSARVRVSVYDMSGRLLSDLVRSVQSPGVHHVQWDAEEQASGIYMYRIVAIGLKKERRFSKTEKMMLIK
jgi:hypothetical protein